MNRIVYIALGVASLAFCLFGARAAHADPPQLPPLAQPLHAAPAHAWAFATPLRSMTLRPDQQAEAQRIEATMDAAAARAKVAMIEFLRALSAQVDESAIDAARLREKLNAAAHAMETEWRAGRGADQRLHDLLDKRQRVELVGKIEEMFSHLSHFSPPQRSDVSPLPPLPAGVALTPAQRQTLAAMFPPDPRMPSFSAVFDAMRRDLDAFKEDRYLRPVLMEGTPRPWEVLGGFVDGTKKILSVLTPEQRRVVARSFAEHAKDGVMAL